MKGQLLNWFNDWGRAISEKLGTTWLAILIGVFSFIALYLLQDVLRASINKPKIVIKWFEIFLFVVFMLFIVWFIFLI